MGLTISNKELVYQHIADSLAKIKPDMAIASRKRAIFVKETELQSDSKTSIHQLLVETLPFSIKVRKLTELAAEIKRSHDANPWGLRDYSLTYKITILLDEILERYWDDFPVNFKVDLLSKLNPLINILSVSRDPLSFLGYIFVELVKSPISTIQTIWRSIILLSKLVIYSVFNKTAFRELSATAILNRKAQIKIRSTIQKIIDRDSYLINAHQIVSTDNNISGAVDFVDLDINREIAGQKKIFKQVFSETIDKYPNQYVLFDNGRILDSDRDPDVLLERIFKTDFVKERIGKNGTGIYCYFIPGSIFESETKEYRGTSSKFMMKVWAKESEVNIPDLYSDEELVAYDKFYERLLKGE